MDSLQAQDQQHGGLLTMAWPADAAPAPELSVVVPIYDEEENIPVLYERLTGALAALGIGYEIIAVDDGSHDRSFAFLRERARADVVVTIDADLQNDPADIPRLLEKIAEGYDVVSGWRAHRQDAFWNRRLPSIIANRLISLVTGLRLHDYGCSLKAYRREVVQDLQLYGELHRFIPAIASWQGVNVDELPVNNGPRLHGKSKYGISRTLRVVLDLLTVRFLLSYATRPMQIFGLLGLVLSGVGGLILGYLGFVRLVLGEPISARPLTLLGVLVMVLGIQFISIGLLGEMIVRSARGGQQNSIYRVREELNADAVPAD